MVLFTVDEVAHLVKRSKSTIYRWICCDEHLGPYFKKIGGKPMLSEEDFLKYCEEQKK